MPWSLSFALAGLSAAGIATASGCGGDPQPESTATLPIESLRAELADASCEHQVRCGLMPSKEVCLRLDQTDPTLLQLLADVVYGEVEYDPAAARACADARRAQSCESLLSVESAVEAACRGVFKGGVAKGGACLVDGECADGGVCDRSACADGGEQCCFGVCEEAPARAAVGEGCSAAACVDEAFCDEGEGGEGGGGPAPTCKARSDNGEACTASNSCRDGQRCARNGDSGKCYILAKEGERCNPSLEVACLSFDNFCDPGTSTCTKLPGDGQPCAAGNRCLAYAACDGGTCRARPDEGDVCPPDGPTCLGDLRCEGELCIPPQNAVVCVPSDGDE